MSETKKPFTKRQLSIIIKIAFIESMLIVFVLPSSQSTGEITLLKDSGINFCLIPTNSLFCEKIITYKTTFSSVPSVMITEGVITGIPSTFSTTSYLSFFGVNSTLVAKWRMPAPITEIFGDTGQHWVQADTSNQRLVYFTVNCIQGSFSANSPDIRLQYSTNTGGTWINTTLTQSIFFADCPNRNTQALNPFTLPQAAIGPRIMFRLVGENGDGSVVTFTQAYLVFASMGFTVNAIVTPQSYCSTDPTKCTITSFTVRMSLNFQNPSAFSVNATFAWVALGF